ncbi:hypothetical protein BO85DRAFT_454251 [Aspergillus piperis CBS 112811]|uniref:Uncharacterized protein n=1 Tax=Aspergillus piperis CBS 112811 TaxID=1448313 RepID=A0A8G1QQ48_9EURO|nr:hypothetical protein BO85DRAFT_454251 [Aspergillus piperis CBS 112811]RAH52196.1 hypothetical protein BO85DRAFT_454251 [Aspergillus piperis CBS 112811]
MAPHERKSDETQSGLDAWDWRTVNKEGGEQHTFHSPPPSSHAHRMGWLENGGRSTPGWH